MMKPRTTIDDTVIKSSHIGLQSHQDGVSVTRSAIIGKTLGAHVTGKGFMCIGNYIEGGMQIGGPAPSGPSIDELARAIEELSNESDKKKLMTALDRLAGAGEREDRQAAYEDFVANLANHITVLGPFLPALASLMR